MNSDKMIIDAIKLFNTVSRSYKINDVNKVDLTKIDSMDKFNLVLSFEETFAENSISFGNNEKEIKKIFKSKKSLLAYIKKNER